MRPTTSARYFSPIVPCWVTGLTLLSAAPGETGDFAAEIRPLLSEYCLRCHGEEEIEGGVDLTGLQSEADLVANRELWESVIEQIDTEEMPTKGPHPTGAEREALTRWLRARFAEVDWSLYHSPGRVTLPRLTKAEYRRTLRDLLGVDLHAGVDLPEDGEGESGFTNDRDGLSLTSSEMELFFASAERAIAGVFALARPPWRQGFEAEAMTRSPEKLKPQPSGVLLVHPDHEVTGEVLFPADGWYRFQIHAAVVGDEGCVAEVLVDGELVAAARVEPAETRRARLHEMTAFVRAGQRSLSLRSRNLVPQTPEPPDIVRLIDERARDRAPRLAQLTEKESASVSEAREGLNTKAVGMQESIEWLRFLGPDGDSRKIDLRRVYFEERAAQWRDLRDRLAALSGRSAEEIERAWRSQNTEALADHAEVLASVAEVKWEDWTRYQGRLFMDRLEISGPVMPDPAGAVGTGWTLVGALRAPDANPESLIRELLPRAFRRPVKEEEIQRHLTLLRRAQREEEGREAALTVALTAILTSPSFLYREQSVGDGGVVDDWAMASRLSYFLWQTMPDDELFDLAASGLLGDPVTLAAQTDRLLGDPRAGGFFETFTLDWLGIRELGRGIAPDPSRFPAFSPDLAEAMKAESVAFVASVFREDQPVSAFIDAPVAYLNETLATHYGIPGVTGGALRPVALDDSRRGGVLGLGSVLVVTSSPSRTNPVRRGAWVMERLLGEDPGEALPSAGVLPGNAGEARGLTLREELERHRTRADCARCHDRIDPLGFGLQNFDATGRWRDLEAGRPVDARGKLPGGSEFSGPVELKEVLLAGHRREITENLARRLLAFALGRKLEWYDRSTIETVVDRVEAAGGSARELVRAVVDSEAFRYQAEGGQ